MAYIESNWRRVAAPIIAAAIAAHPQGGTELTLALRAAYPFGERKYHPYKIWLSEIKRQTGGKPPKIDPRRPVFGSKESPFGEVAR